MEDLVSDLDTGSSTLLSSFWEEDDSMRTFFLCCQMTKIIFVVFYRDKQLKTGGERYVGIHWCYHQVLLSCICSAVGKMMHSSPWQDSTMQSSWAPTTLLSSFLSVHTSCCFRMQHSATTGMQQFSRMPLYNFSYNCIVWFVQGPMDPMLLFRLFLGWLHLTSQSGSVFPSEFCC